jgi:hypothetical protein
MLSRTTRLLAILPMLALTTPAWAQVYDDGEFRDATESGGMVLLVHAGGFNALTDLNESGSANFKNTGYNLGAGLGWMLSSGPMFRANATYTRNQLEITGFDPTDYSRWFIDGALQFQPSVTTDFRPYLFIGGGLVTLHEVGTENGWDTRPAGTAGIGFNYEIPRSSFGLFAEGKGWVYRVSDFNGALAGVDETQVEIVWSGGLSYRLPF